MSLPAESGRPIPITSWETRVDHHQEHAATPHHEVRERMSPAFAARLLDALEDQARGPAVRTHDGKELLADAKTRS
jgi:hypothetical protein